MDTWRGVKVMLDVIVEVVLREAISQYTYCAFAMDHQSKHWEPELE